MTLAVALAATACSSSPTATTPTAASSQVAPVASLEITQTDGDRHWSTGIAAGDPIPVTEADPLLGSPDAPVTIVVFGDVTHPSCAREQAKLDGVRETYGSDKVRIAWKQLPAERDSAKDAAALGAAIFEVGGSRAFFAFARSVFATRIAEPKTELAEALILGAEAANREVSFKPSDLRERIDGAGPKLAEDAALAKTLQVRAVPTFFINGIRLSGGVAPELWKRVVDAELEATAEAIEKGNRSTVYAERLGANTRAGFGVPSAEARTRNPPDETVYPATIGASPVRGKPDALVTIVEFGDFEEHYSRSLQGELSRLRTHYGDKVRLVFKLAPQPRHDRGALAAELAALILDKKGVDAFWAAHDALYAAPASLEDATLERVAKEAGLEPKTTLAALKSHKHAGLIDADRDLADDLKVGSLPQIFINGKRLKGVQAEGYIASIIDAEIASAERRVEQGTRASDVYAVIMRDAKPMRAFDSKPAPLYTKDNPQKGAATPAVTVQVFCDYASPFCRKVWSTLDELDKSFPSKLRFVWRSFPIKGTVNAMPSAIAGAEVKRQKGDASFWKWNETLFASSDRDVLSRASLDKLAASFSLDVKLFDAALDAPAPPGVVAEDLRIAAELGVAAAPTTFVGDFVVVGAQSLDTFKHAVRAATAPKP